MSERVPQTFCLDPEVPHTLHRHVRGFRFKGTWRFGGHENALPPSAQPSAGARG